MKKIGNIIAVAGILIILILSGLSYWDNKATAPPEKDSVGSTVSAESQAVEQAKKNGESMWLLFRSTTCAPCIEMQKIYDQLKPEYKDKVRFIAIDVNDSNNLDLIRKWQIRYIPTTFIVDGAGKVTYQNVGVIPVEDLKKELNKVAK